MATGTVQTGSDSITKNDVPFFSTSTGVLCGFCTVVGGGVLVLAWKGVYPGVMEAVLGILFGLPVGLLVSWRWIVRATAAAMSSRRRAERPMWQALDPDWGWTAAGYAIAVLIAALAFLVDYWLWVRAPGLAMPWARFADADAFRFTIGSQTLPPDRGFPFSSMAMVAIAGWLVGHLVATIRMILWYNNLPPHTATRPTGHQIG